MKTAMFSDEEIAQYRQEREDKKAEAEALAAKTAEDEAKAARQQLETDLQAHLMSVGGSLRDWLRLKDRLIDETLVQRTLEAARPKVEDAPEIRFSKGKYN